jgi:transcription elongation factor GreA
MAKTVKGGISTKMEHDKVYLTAEGITKLRDDLDHLKNVRRPALAERLHHAIQQGDLSENADYQTTKEEQGFVEGRIQELESMLLDAVVIDSSQVPKGQVGIGSRVIVTEEGEDDAETFVIVGAAESDPAQGRISYESPIGRALIDRKVGDKVTVKAPVGDMVFVIKGID